jgi:hypothetical protein
LRSKKVSGASASHPNDSSVSLVTYKVDMLVFWLNPMNFFMRFLTFLTSYNVYCVVLYSY